MSPNLVINTYLDTKGVRHCRFIYIEASPNAQVYNKQPTHANYTSSPACMGGIYNRQRRFHG